MNDINQYNLTVAPEGKWSGVSKGFSAPPAIGERVNVTMNSGGPGEVTGYFLEHGSQAQPFVGVYVKLDNEPAWRKNNPRQAGKPMMVFGTEISKLEPVSTPAPAAKRIVIARSVAGRHLEFFFRINKQHMVASFTEDIGLARSFATVRRAENFMKTYSRAGYGMADCFVQTN